MNYELRVTHCCLITVAKRR